MYISLVRSDFFGANPCDSVNPKPINNMNKLSILALTAISATAFAGQEIAAPEAPARPSKTVIPQEACFGETELQLDLYMAHVDSNGNLGEGYGGGLALTYFFHRNFGVTIDGNLTESDTADTVWQASAGFIARYPFEVANLCLSPYAKLTGGVQSEDGTNPFIAVGAGLEWRVSSRVGLFGEGTYGFVDDSADFVTVRAGLRLVF